MFPKNYEYVEMEIKQNPPGYVRLCGELPSFPMVQTILGDESWDYTFTELFPTAQLTITPKTNIEGNAALQYLKMEVFRIFQDDDFTIMPNSMSNSNGTEKLMWYKQDKVVRRPDSKCCII